tara:strand:- start:344 stop:589 length:246 start_codon:yes stop_codon:yes gene_type:complete
MDASAWGGFKTSNLHSVFFKNAKKKTSSMMEAENIPARIFYKNIGMREANLEKHFILDCLNAKKYSKGLDNYSGSSNSPTL